MRVAMIPAAAPATVENIALWDGVAPWCPFGYFLVDVTSVPCGPGWGVVGLTVGVDDVWASATFTDPTPQPDPVPVEPEAPAP